MPEPLHHRRIWRDVLRASLAVQSMALAVPICMRIVIDQVIVHPEGFGKLVYRDPVCIPTLGYGYASLVRHEPRDTLDTDRSTMSADDKTIPRSDSGAACPDIESIQSRCRRARGR